MAGTEAVLALLLPTDPAPQIEWPPGGRIRISSVLPEDNAQSCSPVHLDRSWVSRRIMTNCPCEML